ncbi:MAG TPA: AlpA family phage regulatory protein [Roseiarcus sp.]|jgi:predicted DNA-binding transcriptional regulator AlpA|nr:AlpA family phage regulatory protein [Roseiarcus sp.]
MSEIEDTIREQVTRAIRKREVTAIRDQVWREHDAAIRDQVRRELDDILRARKFGDQVVAERLEDALLNESTVEAITSVPRAELRRLITAGTFPSPLQVSKSTRSWFLSEISAWIVARREELADARRASLRRKAGLPQEKIRPPRRDPWSPGQAPNEAINAQG